MITVRWALGVIVAASAASASTDELQLFSRLLKRQEPGTPEYNCHDNCGQAIIQARNSDDVCNDDIFVTDYENCLQCSGPDNVDIWRFYGNSLSRAAEPCGLPTTPLSGEQPDVGPALPAGSSSGGGGDEEESSSAKPTEAPTSTTADEEKPTATMTEEEQPTATSDEGTPSETADESAPTQAPTEGGESYPTAVPSTSTEKGAPSVTATTTESGEYPVTPAPTASTTYGGNGTVSSGTAAPDASSTGVIPVASAVTLSGSSLGFYGVLALGALLAFAQ